MLEEEKPEVTGHLDKIKMYNRNNTYFSENESWYCDRIETLLPVIKSSGSIVEVNTRGYYKYNQADLYPSAWIIRKLIQHNIPIALNSDCHRPEEILSGFTYAVRQLEEAGLKELWAFFDNKWQPFRFTKDGIIL
jgi:histidinol-phosphatase (PHP family)